jgi:hypothetical protein
MGHLGYLKGVFMTKAEMRKQQNAEKRAQKLADLAALVPNPRYRIRLSNHEIYAGMKRPPRFIPPPCVDLFNAPVL